jgi:hypothetical protein
MMTNQLTRGKERRVMYVENKDGEIDGVSARIGWVTFSKTGLTVSYHGRTLKRTKGRGIMGNYRDDRTGEEFWVSGLKVRGSNVHWAEHTKVVIDSDARNEYDPLRKDAE